MAEAMTCDICGKFIVDFSKRYVCNVSPSTYLDDESNLNEIERIEFKKDLCLECFKVVAYAVRNTFEEVRKVRR